VHLIFRVFILWAVTSEWKRPPLIPHSLLYPVSRIETKTLRFHRACSRPSVMWVCSAPEILFHILLLEFTIIHSKLWDAVSVTTTLGTWQSAPTRLCLSFKTFTNICQVQQMFPCTDLWYSWPLVHLSLACGVDPGSYACALFLVHRNLLLYLIGNHFV
jgi:hypothetical protein